MTEWTVVGVIIAVVGLITAVAKPMLNLNASITRLTIQLEGAMQELRQFSERNSKGHDRLWKKNQEQDELLDDHEHRLTVLEEHKK